MESSRYPYVPLEVRVGELSWSLDTLVNTGLEGDVVLPNATVFEQDPNAYSTWVFADGTWVEAPVYLGTVRIGSLDPVPARIAALGEEAIVGRGVVDRYRVTFDHGQRVSVEP